MPITQYSKIKHRRGQLVDLPTLDGSEIGHAVDERRVFIGNGEVSEGAPVVGNTEILTEYSPITDLVNHIYRSNTPVTATTGATASTPVIRSLQEVLDDRLSVKSYGATGDGITIDDVAINRAMEDIYTQLPPVEEQAYRIIFFPAGIYLLDTNPVYMPPNTILIGEGKGRTIIRQTNSGNPVLETVDDNFQEDMQIGDSSATLPENIYVHNMTLEHVDDSDVVSLHRASKVTFIDCEIKGGFSGTPSTAQLVNITPLGMTYTHHDISFRYCDFSDSSYVMSINAANANNITFDHCKFSNLYRGMEIFNTAYNINVTNCVFDTVEEYAMFVASAASHITTQNNLYRNCGLPGVPSSSSGTACVFFDTGATKCSSLNDKFMLDTGVIPVFNPLNTQNFILNPSTNFVFGNVTYTQKSEPVVITGSATNVSTGIAFDMLEQDAVFIDYSVKRSGLVRIGKMHISYDGTDVAFDDYYTETNDMDVTFSYDLSGDVVTILYTTTTGDVGELHYQVKSWLM